MKFKSLNLPAQKNVEAGYEIFQKIKEFSLADEIISEYFKRFPQNTNLKEVIQKVILVNRLYRAGVMDEWTVAKRIQDKHIDDKIAQCDRTVIEDIGEGESPNTGKKYLLKSFASKYCYFHKYFQEEAQLHFPMYDKFAVWMLKRINNGLINPDKLGVKNKEIEKDYKKYCKAIETVMRKVGLETGEYLKLDKFLWLAGQFLTGNKNNALEEFEKKNENLICDLLEGITNKSWRELQNKIQKLQNKKKRNVGKVPDIYKIFLHTQ